MSISGESDMYGENWRARLVNVCRRTAEVSKEDSAAAIARWREGGGYIGALSRLWREPTDEELAVARVKYRAKPARGHMPFPGHRHMGELP